MDAWIAALQIEVWSSGWNALFTFIRNFANGVFNIIEVLINFNWVNLSLSICWSVISMILLEWKTYCKFVIIHYDLLNANKCYLQTWVTLTLESRESVPLLLIFYRIDESRESIPLRQLFSLLPLLVSSNLKNNDKFCPRLRAHEFVASKMKHGKCILTCYFGMAEKRVAQNTYASYLVAMLQLNYLKSFFNLYAILLSFNKCS